MRVADEGDISMWLPGLFGSLAAAPQVPGWAIGIVYYHTSISAEGSVAEAREVTIGKLNPTINVNLDLNLKASADLVIIDPSYTFATPVLGGQFNVNVAGIVGRRQRRDQRNIDGQCGTLRRDTSGQHQQLLDGASATSFRKCRCGGTQASTIGWFTGWETSRSATTIPATSRTSALATVPLTAARAIPISTPKTGHEFDNFPPSN